jgi:hypothetical protein
MINPFHAKQFKLSVSSMKNKIKNLEKLKTNNSGKIYSWKYNQKLVLYTKIALRWVKEY